MQSVSETYNPYADVRRVELSFSFGVIAPEAAALAAPSSSPQSPVSQIGQTVDEIEEMSGKYTSLETNIWVLDGSMDIYPGGQVGWQPQAVSDGQGDYAEDQWIEFEFDEPQTSYGFTLIFDNTMPDNLPAHVTTTTFDATGQIGTITTTPDDYTHVVSLQTMDYTRVRFSFPGTAIPNRRVRVCGVRFGIEYVYNSKNTTSVTVRQSVSPWAETLPSVEIDATIDNSDQLYNMVNPAGLYAYLQDGQFMEYAVTIDGESVFMGRGYFTSAESEDGGLTASITFNDRFMAFDDIYINSGATGSWTLADAVASILSATGTEMEAVFDGSLFSVIVGKAIPQNTTAREALRLCAQAAMCTCFIDRQNKIHFVRPVIGTASDVLTRDVQRQEAQVKVGQSYNAVKLTVRDEYAEDPQDVVYTASDVAADDFERVYEVSNPLVVDGDAVAQWILSWVKRRTSYDVSFRGNPALDLLDTVQINDVYGVNGLAVLTKLDLSYDGGLSCDAEGIR